MNTITNQDKLEQIVDTLGVKDTLEALAQVCYDKSSHLYENWQDSNSGDAYASVGHAINDFAYKTIEKRFGFTG